MHFTNIQLHVEAHRSEWYFYIHHIHKHYKRNRTGRKISHHAVIPDYKNPAVLTDRQMNRTSRDMRFYAIPKKCGTDLRHRWKPSRLLWYEYFREQTSRANSATIWVRSADLKEAFENISSLIKNLISHLQLVFQTSWMVACIVSPMRGAECILRFGRLSTHCNHQLQRNNKFGIHSSKFIRPQERSRPCLV